MGKNEVHQEHVGECFDRYTEYDRHFIGQACSHQLGGAVTRFVTALIVTCVKLRRVRCLAARACNYLHMPRR